jgi:hypothetical protein
MRFNELTACRPNMGAAHEGPLTVGAAAATLESLLAGGAIHAQTQKVVVTIEAQPVRLTLNGTTPTATLGFNLIAGTVIELSRAEAEGAKFIRAGATDATVQVAQYLH